jgi:type IV pilus assembly protein PilM
MGARRSSKLRDHTVLALDIGTRFIKIAEIRYNRGKLYLYSAGIRPTPANVIDNNQILDPVGLGRAIRELLTVGKFGTRKTIVSLSGQTSVVVRPIDLPKMSKKELGDTMKFEVERHIPFTVDEVIMDYAPLVDPATLPEEESNMKVLLAVAQEELVKTYLKVMAVAGMQPVAMDVEILAAIRALVDSQQDNGSYEQTLALINIGAGSTDISIIDKGHLAFTRSVPIAGDALTEAIAEQLGRDFDEAEELKVEYGRVLLDSELELLDTEGLTAAESPDSAAPQAPAMPEPALTFFDAFEPATPTVAPVTPPPPPAATPVFSLDADLPLTPQPMPAVTMTPPSPSMSFTMGQSTAFLLDEDDVDDELPVFRFQPADTVGVPTFELDDDIDDDIALPITFTSPTASSMGPVFDLSSEVEALLPPPLVRPTTADAAAGEEPALPGWTLPPAPTASPAMPTSSAAATPVFSTSFADLDFLASSPAPPSESPAPQEIADTALEPFADPLVTPVPAEVPRATPASFTAFDRPEMPFGDQFQNRIYESMQPMLSELITEIRRSLEYYSSREPDTPIERIVLYGGTSRMPSLAEFIHNEIGLEVVLANPVELLDLTYMRQSPQYLEALAPSLPVCIGLALRDMIA